MSQKQTPYFMGMTRQNGGMYGDISTSSFSPSSSSSSSSLSYPNFQTNVGSNTKIELPFTNWWNKYSQAMYILARTFQIIDDKSIPACKLFFKSLISLIPDSSSRFYLKEFLSLKPWVVERLQQTIPTLFQSYPRLLEKMKDSNEFYESSMKNLDGQSLLIWVYMINAFLYSICKEQSIKCELPTLNEIRFQYHPERITKYDWGNAIWYILHTASLYAPEPVADSFVHYKNLLYSLQWLLPCPKCRIHLSQNLDYIDLDQCPRNREELFKCSWKLHNIVNKSDGKSEIPLQNAFALYTMK